MTQTRFTCNLTKADEPHASPTHESPSWTPKGPQPAAVLVTPWPPLMALLAPVLTGPTPTGSTNGSARP